MAGAGISICFVGHATVFLEIDGLRILTDPFLRGGFGPVRRVGASVDMAPLRDVDLVLISHAHLDHLDIASLRMLGPRSRLVMPKGTSRRVAATCANEIVEMAVGDEISSGPLAIRATPAVHELPRIGPGRGTLAMGYLVEGTQRLYFAGDTDLFPGMAGLSADLDVALLPIWGWGPRLGTGHMDPQRAAEAAALLRPRVAIPIHWGTLWPVGLRRLGSDRLRLPPIEFAAAVARLEPRVRAIVLQPGECTNVDRDDATGA